jgi:integrase
VREPSADVAKVKDTTRNKGKIESKASATDYLDAGSFDNALSVIESFLKWSLDAANRGGRSLLTFEKLILERSRLELIFDQLRIGAAQSHRLEPLEEHELEAIRKAIAPSETTDGWRFPRVFSPGTRFRNWLMFETALELGLRRGELLKLKVASLPRGSDTGIRVIRYPDDPEDTRAREPAVKTAERILPAPRGLLGLMNIYLTSLPPVGRVSGMSPYLFVTVTGAPTSIDRSDDIIEDIAGYSGVDVSWHRLRHTWAEKMAQLLCEKPTGLDQLQWLGGWTNPESPKRYIQNAIARSARETVRRIQELQT